MDILFLGTCACDYSPKLSTEFKDKFDYDARRSSCALLNGHILIDCGDHTPDSLRISGSDIGKITDIVITHLHSDHFKREFICSIAKESGHTINLWVREDAPIEPIESVVIRRMKPTETYEMDGGEKLTGLKANHGEKTCPQYIYIENGGKNVLYATDGAWFLSETYYYLKNKNLDAMIIDATCGDYTGDYRMGEHNSLPMIRLMLPSLKTWGTITDKTQVYLTHIAPSLHKPHKEIVKSVEPYGLKVAYDGLQIKI